MSDVFVKVINSDLYKTRDANFQQIPSAIITQGVQKDYQNELAVTTNQVASGRAFVTMKRTTLTPNEEFLTVVELPEDTIIDTSGDGYIVIKFDETKINDSTLVDSTASNVATIEKVTSLPSDNYILLASLASGVITDERVWAELDENIIPQSYFYDEDAESDDAYAITIRGFKGYVDGMQLAFKANTANTGACTLNVNSEGAKDIKKNFSLDLIDNDIRENQIVVVRYNSTTDDFEMISPVGNATSIPAFATDSDMETATSETTISAPAKVKHAIDYFSTDAVAEAVEALSKGDPVKITENSGSAFCHKAIQGIADEVSIGTSGRGYISSLKISDTITLVFSAYMTTGTTCFVRAIKNENGKLTVGSSGASYSISGSLPKGYVVNQANCAVNSSGVAFVVISGGVAALEVNPTTLAITKTEYTSINLDPDNGGGIDLVSDSKIFVVGKESAGNWHSWVLNWTGSAFNIAYSDDNGQTTSGYIHSVNLSAGRALLVVSGFLYSASISDSGSSCNIGTWSSGSRKPGGYQNAFYYDDGVNHRLYYINSENANTQLWKYWDNSVVLSRSGIDLDSMMYDSDNDILYTHWDDGEVRIYKWNDADPQLLMIFEASNLDGFNLQYSGMPLFGMLGFYATIRYDSGTTNRYIAAARNFKLAGGASGICDETTSEGSNATIKKFRKVSGLTGKTAGEKLFVKTDGTFEDSLIPVSFIDTPLIEYISATEGIAL